MDNADAALLISGISALAAVFAVVWAKRSAIASERSATASERSATASELMIGRVDPGRAVAALYLLGAATAPGWSRAAGCVGKSRPRTMCWTTAKCPRAGGAAGGVAHGGIISMSNSHASAGSRALFDDDRRALRGVAEDLIGCAEHAPVSAATSMLARAEEALDLAGVPRGGPDDRAFARAQLDEVREGCER